MTEEELTNITEKAVKGSFEIYPLDPMDEAFNKAMDPIRKAFITGYIAGASSK